MSFDKSVINNLIDYLRLPTVKVRLTDRSNHLRMNRTKHFTRTIYRVDNNFFLTSLFTTYL